MSHHRQAQGRRQLSRQLLFAIETKWKSRFEAFALGVARWGTRLYFLAVVAVFFVLLSCGDVWWPTSVILFGPRWLGLVPILVIGPLALSIQPRQIPLLVISALVYVWGIMGLCLPSIVWMGVQGRIDPVRIMTCNIQAGNGGWEKFRRMLYEEQPTIVALQEVFGLPEGVFPSNWHVASTGEFVVASPFPIVDASEYCVDSFRADSVPIAQYTAVCLPSGTVSIFNVHPTSPHRGLSAILYEGQFIHGSDITKLKEVNDLRQRESAEISAWIARFPRVDFVVGDFNLPVESRIYRQNWGGFRNAFNDAGFGFGYTRWQKIHNFSYGVRIDHILTTDTWYTADCYVGRDIGSDHLPVVAEVYSTGLGQD